MLRAVQERLDSIASSVFPNVQHLKLHSCAFATCAQAEMVSQSVSHTPVQHFASKHQQKHPVNMTKCTAKMQQLCRDMWQEMTHVQDGLRCLLQQAMLVTHHAEHPPGCKR